MPDHWGSLAELKLAGRPKHLICAAFGMLLLESCVGSKAFRVIPAKPAYLLRSPDAQKTPFPDVLQKFNGFQPGQNSIDLRPLMELRIENAYYEKGASRRGLAGFLGTELAQYEIKADGLDLLSFHPMTNRPEDELPVQNLISNQMTKYRFYRFYYEIVFAASGNSHGSALLGANSMDELNQLSSQITNAETVCNPTSVHCTVFPEACSVSVEMRIVVNSKPQTVVWGSVLESVADHPQHLQIKRLYAGQLLPIRIDIHKAGALRLPLLPGDQITWN